MCTPGFSLSDLTQAVDTATLIILQLKEAPNALQSVIKGIEFGRAVLKSWKRQLEDHPENIHADDRDLLVGVKADYDAIINQLEAFVRKHRKLENGSLGARFKWVITDHFLNERRGLENDLQNVEARVRTVLQMLSWSTGQEILRLGRANSFACSLETLPQSDRNALQTVCEQAGKLPSTPDNSGAPQFPPPPPSLASPTTPSPSSWVGYHWNPRSSISSSTTQDSSNETVDTPPSHYPSSNFSSPPTSPYSVNRSSPILPPLPRPLPPPTIERMPINGEIRIWYRASQDYYEKVLRDLDIARISGRGASKVQMTTKNGTEIVHRGCGNLTDMAMTILPQQGDLPKRVRKVDPRISYLIKFREQHELYTRANMSTFFTGSPEYSFTDEKDYENFQTMITGKTNVSNVGTLTISISGDEIISDSQVLQIWDSNGTRTIRFFRNATDRKFSECKIAGLKQYHSKKRELRLEFRNGYDFDNFKKLKIVFASESARDKFERLAQFSNG